MKPHQSESIHPKKQLSQNFLKNPYAIGVLVEHIRPCSTDHMVEIGPGLGALTQRLWPAVNRLDVIERDDRLADRLQTQAATIPPLHVHHADALTFDLQSIPHNKPFRLVGNLPYHIATPLLMHYLTQIDMISDMHLMFQKEVAARLCAKAGEAHYGRLSLMAQYDCEMEYLCDIPKEAFHPEPKITSGFVRFTPHKAEDRPMVDRKRFQRIITRAFHQRRKMIRKSLATMITSAQLEALAISPTARAEELDFATYVRIANEHL